MDMRNLHSELTGAVIGCAMEVHKELGSRFPGGRLPTGTWRWR